MSLKRLPGRNTAFALLGIALVASATGIRHQNRLQRTFPSTAEVQLPNGDVINAEVSATWPATERGLMGRASLSRGAGMLFVYPSTGRHRHWMN